MMSWHSRVVAQETIRAEGVVKNKSSSFLPSSFIFIRNWIVGEVEKTCDDIKPDGGEGGHVHDSSQPFVFFTSTSNTTATTNHSSQDADPKETSTKR